MGGVLQGGVGCVCAGYGGRRQYYRLKTWRGGGYIGGMHMHTGQVGAWLYRGEEQ